MLVAYIHTLSEFSTFGGIPISRTKHVRPDGSTSDKGEKPSSIGKHSTPKDKPKGGKGKSKKDGESDGKRSTPALVQLADPLGANGSPVSFMNKTQGRGVLGNAGSIVDSDDEPDPVGAGDYSDREEIEPVEVLLKDLLESQQQAVDVLCRTSCGNYK